MENTIIKNRRSKEFDVSQKETYRASVLKIHRHPFCGEVHYREIVLGYGACRKCGCKGFEHVIGNGWICGNCGHKKEDHF